MPVAAKSNTRIEHGRKVSAMAESSISQRAQGTTRRGGPAQWANDLTPVGAADWGFDFAGHLLERAGFGGTPDDIARLAAMPPQAAVAFLVDYRTTANDHLPAFERSDVWDPTLRDFPVSR